MSEFSLNNLNNLLQLKRKSINIVDTKGSLPYSTHSYQYTRMYKRTQFNINVGVQQIQNYFSSKYRPNILNIPITIRANGIVSSSEYKKYLANPTSSTATFTGLYQEFYVPCLGLLSSFINNLLHPKDMLLIGVQQSSDAGSDILNIVEDTFKDEKTTYKNVSMGHTYTYKIYYPILSDQDDTYRSTSTSLESNVIGLNISAQDKVYNLSKNMINFHG